MRAGAGVAPWGLWLSAVAGFCSRILSPVVIDRIDQADGAVVIAAHPGARGSRCRRCGRVSTRVQSRYRRHLADLPVPGRPVAVWLTVRRVKPRCPRRSWCRWQIVQHFSAYLDRISTPCYEGLQRTAMW